MGAVISASVAIKQLLHINGIVLTPDITLPQVIDIYFDSDLRTRTEVSAALAIVSLAPVIMMLPLWVVVNVLRLLNNRLKILVMILVIIVR